MNHAGNEHSKLMFVNHMLAIIYKLNTTIIRLYLHISLRKNVNNSDTHIGVNYSRFNILRIVMVGTQQRPLDNEGVIAPFGGSEEGRQRVAGSDFPTR